MSNSLKFDHEEKEGNEDLMSAALFVEAAEDEDDGRPPQDGMAYLRQVIKERKRVPDTVTAEISQKKPKMTRVETQKSGDNSKRNDRVKVPPPPGTCPGSTWQREQMAQFSEVRLEIFLSNFSKYFCQNFSKYFCKKFSKYFCKKISKYFCQIFSK